MPSKNKEPRLTQQEYVHGLGLSCPFCLETKGVQYRGQPSMNEAVVYASVECTECKNEWTDVFELTGFDIHPAEDED